MKEANRVFSQLLGIKFFDTFKEYGEIIMKQNQQGSGIFLHFQKGLYQGLL